MHRTRRASLLLATFVAATVAGTTAAAEPAAGAGAGESAAAAGANAPLLYTTHSETSTGYADLARTVRYDGSGRRAVAAATLTATPNGNGGTTLVGREIVRAATYSPDRSRVTWVQADSSATGPRTFAVEVKTLATGAVASFPLPSGASEPTFGVQPVWYPGGTRLALVVDRDSGPTLAVLDTGSGAYTWLYQFPADRPATSIAVSGDGTLAFASSAGVAVLSATTPTTARFFHPTGTGEQCDTVRERPRTAREFTYVCTTFGTGDSQQKLLSQLPAGTPRTLYAPAANTFVDGFAWSPSGASIALATTSVRIVDANRCITALTTSVSTRAADGSGARTIRTEPTLTGQTCKGDDLGDIDTVVWSADSRTIVFLHAMKLYGVVSAFAVDPTLPASQPQTELARAVVSLSS